MTTSPPTTDLNVAMGLALVTALDQLTKAVQSAHEPQPEPPPPIPPALTELPLPLGRSLNGLPRAGWIC